MMDFAILFIAAACGLLWIGVIAPAILRSLGFPIALGFRNQHLSRTQYVWAVGVFSFGLGSFLFSIVSEYLEWKLLGEQLSYPSPTHIIVGLVIWPLAGWSFGVITAPRRKNGTPN